MARSVILSVRDGVACVAAVGGAFLVDTADLPLVLGDVWYVCAGRTSRTKYVRRAWVAGRETSVHRLLVAPACGQIIDHINRNGLDNRRANLRVCDTRQNAQNKAKQMGRYTSAWKGVHRHRKKWQARIAVDGRRVCLGNFDSEADAAQAYNFAVARYFGEFARFNEVTQQTSWSE